MCITADFLQEDFTKLQEYNKKWLLQFSQEKCKVMYYGKECPAHQYHTGNTQLPATEEVKDLGVYVTRLPVKEKSLPITADRFNQCHVHIAFSWCIGLGDM